MQAKRKGETGTLFQGGNARLTARLKNPFGRASKNAPLPAPSSPPPPGESTAASSSAEASPTLSLYERLLAQAEGDAGRTAAIQHLQSVDSDEVGLFNLSQVLEALQLGRGAAKQARRKTKKNPFWRMSSEQLSKGSLGFLTGAILLFFMFWVFELLATSLRRNTLVTPTGGFANRDFNARMGGTYNPDLSPDLVAVGDTVQLHDLVKCPKLPIRTLRAVRDIVFSHRQAFYIFHVSRIAKRGSAVEFYAADGSTIFIDNKAQRVLYEPPGEAQQEVTLNPLGNTDPWVADAAFMFEAALYQQPSSAAKSDSLVRFATLVCLLNVMPYG